MEIQYDEDLSLNKFFQKLQADHKILIETAPLENWIVCVPRSAALQADNLDDTDFFLAHILVPHDEIDGQYTNLLGVDVKQINGKLLTHSHSSRILFEEIFYVKGLFKYVVWCIELPLRRIESMENGIVVGNEPVGLFIVSGLTDAVQLLWNETQSKAILRKIETISCTFMQNTSCTNRLLIDPILFDDDAIKMGDRRKEIKRIKRSVDILLNHCFQKMMYHKRLYEKCSRDLHFQRVFKIALETYVMDILYRWLFDAVTLCFVDECEKFNHILRNLSDTNLKHFQIDCSHMDVINRVRSELLQIDDHTTPIGKMNCLRRAITAATQYKHNDLSVDDLIPILVFLIIKSGSPHWITTLHYLKHFIFTEFIDGSDKGIDSFIITTLEAAIMYIETMKIDDIQMRQRRNSYAPIEHNHHHQMITMATTAQQQQPQQIRYFSSREQFIDYLFAKICDEDEIEIIKLLKFDKSVEIAIASSDNGNDFNAIDDSGIVIARIDSDDAFDCCGGDSSNDRNDGEIDEGVAEEIDALINCPAKRLNVQNKNGIGAIHVAAMFGLSKITNILLALNVNVNIVDENNYTALHYAAAKGHQSVLLMLLNAGADINATTKDGNTALHLSALNGHTSCVKALLFIADCRQLKIDRDAQNRAGDTPLHLAAKWGFREIVDTLLMYGVKSDIENGRGQTSLDCAHNTFIASMLENAFAADDANDSCPSSDGRSSSPMSMHRSGCLTSSVSSLIDDEAFTQKTANDKIVAAIRNDDTKLALHFLGIDNESDSTETICHPLCDCEKCKRLTARKNNQRKTLRSYRGNINELSAFGVTPLHAAIERKNRQLIEALLKMKATVSTQTRATKQTALHLAVQTQSHDILDLILTHVDESQINLQDANGDTAAHLAVKLNDVQMVEALLKHEPNLELRNNDGKTIGDMAKASLHVNILHLLGNINETNETES